MIVVRRVVPLIFLAASAVAAGRSAASEPVGLNTIHLDTAVIIADGKRPVFEYRYGNVPFKPYVAKLCSPKGVQILRDAPGDHKHHHGLMFGVSVDGVDFWAERPGCGSQKSQPIHQFYGVGNYDWLRHGFVSELAWTEPKGGKTLLLERRTVDVRLVERPRPVTLLTWHSRLVVPPGEDSVTLTGEHYFGLGMRFVATMDKDGRFFSKVQIPGEVVRGAERLARSPWCAYTARVDGKRVTVAIFDHPGNARHPNKMFTMTGPFAYLSATLNLSKEPLRVNAAEALALCYGVALWDGLVGPDDVEALYRRWTTEAKPWES